VPVKHRLICPVNKSFRPKYFAMNEDNNNFILSFFYHWIVADGFLDSADPMPENFAAVS
jgi:hypothetical protein